MLKVKLKENIRFFESDDSSFLIQGKEVKELPEKHFRSYSIKLFLFTGRLRVVEGFALYYYKDSMVYIDKDGLYGKEYGKYYTKDLELDTLIFIEENKVPKNAYNKLNGIIDVVSKEEEKTEEPKEEEEKTEEPKEENIFIKKKTNKKSKKRE